MAGIITIYRISNPLTAKVYIGQTVNYKQRISKYKAMGFSSNTELCESLKAFGFENHVFEVLHELPLDAGKEIGSDYERLYADFHLAAGYELMNMQEPGKVGYKASDKVKEKISSSLKGKKHPPERVAKVSSSVKNIWNNRTDEEKKAIRLKITNTIAAKKCQA